MALKIEEIKKGKIDLTNPVILYESPDYKVAWVGSAEEFIFRCNAYLISSGGINILIDPGGIQHFPQVKDRVTKIVGNPANVTHIITPSGS